MALSQSAVSDLLDAFRAGDGVDLIRDAVRLVMQELIEVEADRGDRRRPLRTLRGPHHRAQRVTATAVGDAGRRCRAADPQAAQGRFFPSILEPRRRIDQALYAVVMEAYVAGVSTRSVDDLVAALGIDSGISKSRGVADLCRAR